MVMSFSSNSALGDQYFNLVLIKLINNMENHDDDRKLTYNCFSICLHGRVGITSLKSESLLSEVVCSDFTMVNIFLFLLMLVVDL